MEKAEKAVFLRGILSLQKQIEGDQSSTTSSMPSSQHAIPPNAFNSHPRYSAINRAVPRLIGSNSTSVASNYDVTENMDDTEKDTCPKTPFATYVKASV